jgi:hypothetical protein
VTTCRSCDAEVVFVPSAKSGKPMILDAKPKKGVICLVGEIDFALDEGTGFSGVIGQASDVDLYDAHAAVVDVYTDHHASCTDPGRWRHRATAPDVKE